MLCILYIFALIADNLKVFNVQVNDTSDFLDIHSCIDNFHEWCTNNGLVINAFMY